MKSIKVRHSSSGKLAEIPADVPLVATIPVLSQQFQMEIPHDINFWARGGEHEGLLDVWRSVAEQAPKTETIILFSPLKAGGGALPIASLTHDFAEIWGMLKDEHRGLAVAFLYTGLDSAFEDFMRKFLLYDAAFGGGDTMIFAPINEFPQYDEAWWNQNYPSMEFHSKVQERNLCYTPEKEVYHIVKALKLGSASLPCLLVFQGHFLDSTVLRISQTSDSALLAKTLRRVFDVIEEANKLPLGERVKSVEEKLNVFIKTLQSKSIQSPITLFKVEFTGVSNTATKVTGTNVDASLLGRLLGL